MAGFALAQTLQSRRCVSANGEGVADAAATLPRPLRHTPVGYTGGMNRRKTPAPHLAQHARLLALCALSLLLHALVIAWIDAGIAAPLPTPGAPPLAVRLLGAAAPAPAPAALPAAPASEIAATALPAPAPFLPAAAPMQPLADMPAQGSATPVTAGDVEAVRTPSRYRVAVPPAASLVYEVKDAAGARAEATLDWDTDGVGYRLEMDGVLGEIESEGGASDAGIAPQRARYRLGAGYATVAFERERGVIVLGAGRRSVQDTPGSQDGASLLLQLAGIGLADPDQLQGMVDIQVGRLDGAAVERYQVLGMETIETPLGAMETLHLARAGAAPLEVWLAPGHGWLPVQLRATAPDGGVRTQVVKEIVREPAP